MLAMQQSVLLAQVPVGRLRLRLAARLWLLGWSYVFLGNEQHDLRFQLTNQRVSPHLMTAPQKMYFYIC